jgi:hypothetical protein
MENDSEIQFKDGATGHSHGANADTGYVEEDETVRGAASPTPSPSPRFRDLNSRQVSSPLDATRPPQEGASIIVPATTSVNSQDGSNVRAPGHKFKPDRYDGSTPWRDFQLHFEECAYLNRWSDVDKAMFLRVTMSGTARQAVTDLVKQHPAEKPPTYAELLDALRKRFDHESQRELYRAKLINMERKPNESLPELASRIRRDVESAYPTYNRMAREDQCIEKFLAALEDTTIRLQVRATRPKTLDESVALAMEIETYATRFRQPTVPRSSIRATSTVSDSVSDTRKPPVSDLTEQIREIVGELLAKPATHGDMSGNDSGKRYNRRGQLPGACWVCGVVGHFARECEGAHNGHQNEQRPYRAAPNAPPTQQNAQHQRFTPQKRHAHSGN